MLRRPYSTSSASGYFKFPSDSQEESFYLASVRQWSDQDVETWLSGFRCAALAPLFSENELRGEVILDLTADTLKEMGIATVGDRARILLAVKQLRQKCAAVSMPMERATASVRRKARPYTLAAPTVSIFPPKTSVSDAPPVTPGSAPFYAPTGAIYFSPLPDPSQLVEKADIPLSIPDFAEPPATSAAPAIRIQNPSPLGPPPTRFAATNATESPDASDEDSPVTPTGSDPHQLRLAPRSLDNDAHWSTQRKQRGTDDLESPRRDPAAAAISQKAHGRKQLARRHGQLYIVAAPPPLSVQSVKAY